MAVGSGVGAYFAVAEETTYGTVVPPTRAYEVTKCDLKKNKNTVQGTGVAAGRLVDRGARRAVTTQDASGSVTVDVTGNGFGLLIAQLLGSAATPVQQATTAAYLQTHVLSDPAALSMTSQLGIPTLGGTLNPYTYPGCKATSGEFSCSIDSLLSLELGLDAQTVTEAQAAITPAYTNQDPFDFSMMAVKIGAYGSEATIQGVTGMSMKLERGMDTKRFYANSGGLKSAPVLNAEDKITGTITADLVTKADLADRFSADTPFSLIWSFTGLLIASTYYTSVQFALPQCYLDTDAPTIDGMDVNSTGYNYTALYDGTHPALTVTYQSTDSTR